MPYTFKKMKIKKRKEKEKKERRRIVLSKESSLPVTLQKFNLFVSSLK